MEENDNSNYADRERAMVSNARQLRGFDYTGGHNAPHSSEQKKKRTGKCLFHEGLLDILWGGLFKPWNSFKACCISD